MPRGSRLDAPGAAHHVMGRGLEGRAIFSSKSDYEHFVERLGHVLNQGGARCLAWALMPNHYHLLLRTGGVPLTRMMSRLLTSYALAFNKRHGRQGYLFQGRYLSLLAEDDASLLARVRYIHLNPLRAGLVEGPGDLETYAWSGHAVVTGKRRAPWQDVESVLERFSGDRPDSIEAYRRFVAEGVGLAGPTTGSERAGIIRKAGEWEIVPVGAPGNRAGEESVEGEDAFIHAALEAEQDREERRSRLRREGWTPARVIARAGEVYGIGEDMVYGAGKKPAQVRARALACKWLVDDLGLSGAAVGRLLRVSQPTVSQQAARGRGLATELGHRLEEDTRGERPVGQDGEVVTARRTPRASGRKK